MFAHKLKLVHCRVIETTSSRLVVYKAHLYMRQFTDVLCTVLSLPLCKQKEHESMFITLPACVVEYALPTETRSFACHNTEACIMIYCSTSCH